MGTDAQGTPRRRGEPVERVWSYEKGRQPLNDYQQSILDFCIEMVANVGRMPTREEVAKQYGYSVHHATDMLKMLAGKGWLRKRYTNGRLTFELRDDDVLAQGHGAKDAAGEGR